jgi:hypothetical protein
LVLLLAACGAEPKVLEAMSTSAEPPMVRMLRTVFVPRLDVKKTDHPIVFQVARRGPHDRRSWVDGQNRQWTVGPTGEHQVTGHDFE